MSSKDKKKKELNRDNRGAGVSKREWDKARKAEGRDPYAKFFADPEPARRQAAVELSAKKKAEADAILAQTQQAQQPQQPLGQSNQYQNPFVNKANPLSVGVDKLNSAQALSDQQKAQADAVIAQTQPKSTFFQKLGKYLGNNKQQILEAPANAAAAVFKAPGEGIDAAIHSDSLRNAPSNLKWAFSSPQNLRNVGSELLSGKSTDELAALRQQSSQEVQDEYNRTGKLNLNAGQASKELAGIQFSTIAGSIGGGKAVSVVDDLVKAKTPAAAKEIAKKTGLNLSDDAANAVAKTSNPQEVQSVLKSAETIQREKQAIKQIVEGKSSSLNDKNLSRFAKGTESNQAGQNVQLLHQSNAKNHASIAQQAGKEIQKNTQLPYSQSNVPETGKMIQDGKILPLNNSSEFINNSKVAQKNSIPKGQQLPGEIPHNSALSTTTPSARQNSGELIGGIEKGTAKEGLPATNAKLASTQSQLSQEKVPYVSNTTTSGKYVNRRGFVDTVVNSGKTPEEVTQLLDNKGFYKVRNTNELAIKAKNFVKENTDLAEKIADSEKIDDATGAITMELIKHHRESGNTSRMLDLIEKVSPKFTQAGRFNQLATLYNSLTPEGILRFAQRQLDRANELSPNLRLKLNNEDANKIVDMVESIGKMPEGKEKTVATKKMLKEIYQLVPSTVAEKIGTLQTMAQLFNPKTIIRNIGGNAIFAGVENVSQTVGAGVDKMVSFITGNRTTALPQLKAQAKGLVSGLKEGASEAWNGINTVETGTQFELNSVPAFRDKFLGTIEKSMGVALQAPDRAAYKAAFEDTVHGLMKANGLEKPTGEIMEIAHYNGLYRTFQDTNTATQLFTGLKKVLNYAGIETRGKRFGLGDFILKYPKTPANLLNRGFAYSPAGFIRTMFEATKPLVGKEFNQKAFVDSFSKALVGTTGLVGMGMTLHRLGIITEAPSKDKDVRAIQKTTGRGGYEMNASALKRFVLSGFSADAAKEQQGDTLFNYDWAQPLAASMAVGANIDAKLKKGENLNLDTISAAGDSISEGVNTFTQQPLISGVQKLFQGQGVTEGLKSVAEGVPSSFVPTIGGQIQQIRNNNTPETYDPRGWKQGLNQAQAKIPFLADSLPTKIGTNGEPQQKFQDSSNTVFNVFFNPAYETKISDTPESKMVMDIYNNSGQTQQMPRVVEKSVKVNGESKKLTTEEYTSLQEYVGKHTTELFNQLSKDKSFNELSDEDKAKELSNLMTDIGTIAKVEVLGDKNDKAKTLKEIKEDIAIKTSYREISDLKKQGKTQEAEDRINELSKDQYTAYKRIAAVEATKEKEKAGIPSEKEAYDQKYSQIQGSFQDKYKEMQKLRTPEGMKDYVEMEKRFAKDLYETHRNDSKEQKDAVIKPYLNDKKFIATFKEVAKEGKMSNTERDVSNLGVRSGEKAKVVYDQIKDMPYEEQKAYLKQLLEKKIISKEVISQMKILRGD